MSVLLSKRLFLLNSKTKLLLLAGINRPIIPAQVTKLAKSIDKMGFIRPIVVAKISFISGKPQYYIVDGQHLYFACLRNAIPIEYTLINIETEEELIEKIALLNASSKSWTLLDYITAWSYINSDYKKLNHYFKTYDFELGVLSSVLSNKCVSATTGGAVSMTKSIKNGTFQIVNEKTNVEILDRLTDVLKIIPRLNRQENKFVCSEYVNFYRANSHKYNHKKFLQELSVKKSQFVLATHEQHALVEMFEDLI